MNSFLQKLGKKTDLDKKKRDVYITQLLLSSFIWKKYQKRTKTKEYYKRSKNTKRYEDEDYLKPWCCLKKSKSGWKDELFISSL